jgi:hypothetical protein
MRPRTGAASDLTDRAGAREAVMPADAPPNA